MVLSGQRSQYSLSRNLFLHKRTHAEELNFGAKVRELEQTFKHLEKKKTNPLWKKTLIYNASVLNVPKQYVEQINKITFNFIWDSKPAKIKRSTIIGERRKGGLKMCDFAIMEKALKIAWINRIQNEVTSSWKIIPDVMVQQYGNLFFLSRCNYDPKLLSLENLSSFYCSILVYWLDFKKSKQNEADFKNEILWNNRNILIDKKPVFYRRWFSHNIIYIRDLFDRHGNLYSYSEFKTLYNLQVLFTTFYGLVDAIPSLWKKTITPQNHTNAEEISVTNLSTGAIYSTILTDAFEPTTSQSKILRHGFTEKTLDKVYQLPFKITRGQTRDVSV